MDWWIYLLILLGVIALWFILSIILFFAMKSAQRKAYNELDKVAPFERDRYDFFVEVITKLEDSGRHLPKSLTELQKSLERAFAKIPVDVNEIKGQNDFMDIYLKKYLDEKGFSKKEEFKSYCEKLNQMLWIDPADKNSPYYKYNKLASRYNSLNGMLLLRIFTASGKYPSAPIF